MLFFSRGFVIFSRFLFWENNYVIVVKIRLLGWIADKEGYREKEIFLDGKKVKIRELVPSVEIEPPDRIVVLVNHKGATLDTEVGDDDYVAVLPVVGGG